MQNGQDRTVGDRVDELVGMPTGRQRAGLGLTITDYACHQQIRVVENCAVGVRQRIAQLATLVDRPRNLGCDMTGNATREREFAEQRRHALSVAGNIGTSPAVAALQPGVGEQCRSAVSRPDDIHHIKIVVDDCAIQVRVDEIQPRRGAPVTQRAGLDVLPLQRSSQQRVVHQIDLADGEIVCSPPVRVHRSHSRRRQRLPHHTSCARHRLDSRACGRTTRTGQFAWWINR
ncbi:hypothetical protein MAUB1S_00078 [Mycolicibacterium aubagnense]